MIDFFRHFLGICPDHQSHSNLLDLGQNGFFPTVSTAFLAFTYYIKNKFKKGK